MNHSVDSSCASNGSSLQNKISERGMFSATAISLEHKGNYSIPVRATMDCDSMTCSWPLPIKPFGKLILHFPVHNNAGSRRET